jgi:hypothetical protein
VERATVNRINGWGWVASILVSAIAPLTKTLSGGAISGRIPIYLGVGIMVLTLVLTRKDFRGIFLPLVMSASGMSLGAALGFALVPFVSAKEISILFAVKWMIGGLVLTWLFGKLLKQVPPEEPEKFDAEAFRTRFEALSEDEKRAELAAMTQKVEEDLADIKVHIKKTNLLAFGLIVVGVILLIASYVIFPPK